MGSCRCDCGVERLRLVGRTRCKSALTSPVLSRSLIEISGGALAFFLHFFVRWAATIEGAAGERKDRSAETTKAPDAALVPLCQNYAAQTRDGPGDTSAFATQFAHARLSGRRYRYHHILSRSWMRTKTLGCTKKRRPLSIRLLRLQCIRGRSILCDRRMKLYTVSHTNSRTYSSAMRFTILRSSGTAAIRSKSHERWSCQLIGRSRTRYVAAESRLLEVASMSYVMLAASVRACRKGSVYALSLL